MSMACLQILFLGIEPILVLNKAMENVQMFTLWYNLERVAWFKIQKHQKKPHQKIPNKTQNPKPEKTAALQQHFICTMEFFLPQQ